MDKKSKIFFIVFFLLIMTSVALTYYRYIVQRDYIIEAEMECDPYTEACFTYVCDPEVDGEDVCTGDPVEDTSYYKIINRNAKNIPLCDPNAEDCEAFVCPEGEEECEMILCDPATSDGIECVDPVAYEEANPLEEVEEEEEGDATEEGTETGEDADSVPVTEEAPTVPTGVDSQETTPATEAVAPVQ